MFERILVAADGRATSHAALLVAADLTTRYHAALTVAHVIQDPLNDPLAAGPFRSSYPALYDQCLADGNAVLKAALVCLGRVQATPLLIDGRMKQVGECLGEAAMQTHADLIVLGRHAQGRISEFLPGSVARDLLGSGRASVLVVPSDSLGQAVLDEKIIPDVADELH